MLEETFLFLPGIHERTERRLWRAGITTWDHVLDATHVDGASKERLVFWKQRIRQTRDALNGPHQIAIIRRMLGTRYLWRAVDHIMDEPRFLDIETTQWRDDVTVVGISDGDFYHGLIKGRNLDAYALRRALAGATCIITFNGSSFDLPILERAFPGAIPDVPHLDMRHVCAQAGLTGGLKRIESRLGIRRALAIRDTDGADAILLWHQHLAGDEDALVRLVDYNAADVLNLPVLSKRVIPALWQHVRHDVPLPFDIITRGDCVDVDFK